MAFLSLSLERNARRRFTWNPIPCEKIIIKTYKLVKEPRVVTVMDALTYPTLLEKRDDDVGLTVLIMVSGAKVSAHFSRALRYGYIVTTAVLCQYFSFHIGDDSSVDRDQACKGRCAREIKVDFRARFANAFENEMTARMILDMLVLTMVARLPPSRRRL